VKSLMKQRKSGSLTGYFIIFTLICALIIIVACTATTNTTPKRQTEREPQKEVETQQAKEQAQQKAQEQKTEEQRQLYKEVTETYNLGIWDFLHGNYEKSLPILVETAKLDKQVYQTHIDVDTLKFPGILSQIGRGYQERGIIDSAFYYYNEGYIYYDTTEVYERSEKYLGNYKHVLTWLQWYYSSEGQIEKYIEFSEIYLKHESNEESRKNTLTSLKTLYMNRKEYDKALEKLDELLVMEPDNKDFENERIGIIEITGGAEALIKEWEKQYLENPNDMEVIWNLIVTYENQLECEKVIEFADKYLALKPDDIDAREKKVSALQSTDKSDEAIALLKELNKMKPEEPKYLLNIAEIFHVDKKNYQEAVRWAYDARRINPGLGEANMMIADIIVDYIGFVKEKYGDQVGAIDHKLIYEVAIEYYNDAAKDSYTKSRAEEMAKHHSENNIRTDEDKFMNKGWDIPRANAYQWVWRYKK